MPPSPLLRTRSADDGARGLRAHGRPRQGVWWPLALIALSGEVGMMVALLNGMAHHESTIVVATYYISMTIFASVQGLCVFDLLPQLTWPSASGLA